MTRATISSSEFNDTDGEMSRNTLGERRHHARLNTLCVVCGKENPHGLKLSFSSVDHVATAEWIPSAGWQSFQDTIHGGIISAVLDEAMSQSIILLHKEAFTMDLQIRFHEKVRVGELLLVKGWVLNIRNRRIFAEATLTTPDGKAKARARGTFLIPKRSEHSGQSTGGSDVPEAH